MMLTLSIPDEHRTELAEMARRLGLVQPKQPATPNISQLVRRLADRYRDEPEPTIALLAAALSIDEIGPPSPTS